MRASLNVIFTALSACFLLALVLSAVLAQLLPLADPLAQNLLNARALPGPDHWLGTDSLGRDTLSRLVFGTREVALGSLLAMSLAMPIGATAGMAAGFLRGPLDKACSAIADMLQSIPGITILLAVLAVFSGDVYIAMATFGILFSGAVFRIVRASTLAIAEEKYIAAARLGGMRNGAIIAKHVATRLRPILIVQTSIVLSLAISSLVGLSFLGLGARPPAPSWGNALQDASTMVFLSPWTVLPPAAFVALTILSLLYLGDRFQDRETARGGRGSIVAPSTRRFEPIPARTTEALLSVHDLSVGVGASNNPLWLISDVNFEVYPGETVGLVGESGAGKSVAARTALGLFPANAHLSGSVRVDGHEMTDGRPSTLAAVRGRRVGFVAQQPMAALDPAFTVGQLLTEAVQTLRGVSKRAARDIALGLLTDVQIRNPKAAFKLYPHQISGGMAQRVGIALAIAGNPGLIIADEPTTALDVTVQRQILSLLRGLQKERRLAIVMVTHDWGVIADTCDRVVTFYAGQVVETAEVREIFARPRHPYTAALRRADPHSQPPGQRLTVIDGQIPPPGTWPRGCRFQNRCEMVTEACRAAAIPLIDVGEGHLARCIHTNAPVAAE